MHPHTSTLLSVCLTVPSLFDAGSSSSVLPVCAQQPEESIHTLLLPQQQPGECVIAACNNKNKEIKNYLVINFLIKIKGYFKM